MHILDLQALPVERAFPDAEAPKDVSFLSLGCDSTLSLITCVHQ
ncbi:SapB/AmfS family lanthipeptide [Amycolatopsis anabasis]|nr:SapB/AmfS family lanthipeptide [Amycolatopsis anabasis]